MVFLTTSDLTGQIAHLNVPVVRLMLIRQWKVHGRMDVSVFQLDKWAADSEGGFTWEDTPEREEWWDEVISDGDCEKCAMRYRDDISVFPK